LNYVCWIYIWTIQPQNGTPKHSETEIFHFNWKNKTSTETELTTLVTMILIFLINDHYTHVAWGNLYNWYKYFGSSSNKTQPHTILKKIYSLKLMLFLVIHSFSFIIYSFILIRNLFLREREQSKPKQ
jgi:hypothetical protein